MILLAHMVILFLMFPGTAKPFTITAVPFNIHVNGTQRFQFLHILVICYFSVFCLFDSSRFNGCEDFLSYVFSLLPSQSLDQSLVHSRHSINTSCINE